MNITVKQIEFKSTNNVNTMVGWIYIPGEMPRGIVQICHGMTEHMGRYHEFMRHLAQNGYAACGVDHIGHGRSAGGQFGFFGEQDGWKTLIDDQHKFHKIVHTELPDQPRIFLLGHSMGSFIARLYVAKYPASASGLILSGTGRSGLHVKFGIRAAEHSIQKNGAHFVDFALQKMAFGSYNQGFAPIQTGMEWLTRDNQILQRNAEDPLSRFIFTAAGFRDLFTLVAKSNQARCFADTPKDLPILLFSGSMDKVGEQGKGPRQVYERYVRAGVTDVDILLYEGGRHEMLNEINREQVYQDILAWLEGHL